MRYCEYPPDPRLAGIVRCYWVFESDAMPDAVDERVVPDGCAELVFHYRDPFSAVVGECVGQPRRLFAGQLTQHWFSGRPEYRD